MTAIKIKDKVLLGIISGLAVSLSFNIIDYISVLLGFNKWHIWQIAASAYFKVSDVNTLPALLLGAVTHSSIIGIMSVLLCYFLYYTGRDYYWLKGLVIGAFFWTLIFGIILRTGIGRIDPIDVGTNFSHLLGHFAAGILISWLITKLADDSVWYKE